MSCDIFCHSLYGTFMRYILRYILSWFIWYIFRFWDIFCHGVNGTFWDIFWDIFCHGLDGTFVRVKRLEPSKNFWLLRKALNWFMPCQRKYKYRNVGEEIWKQTQEKYKRKSGGILSLGRFPDKELFTRLENDFVSDTKMKHNYSKASHKIGKMKI